MTPAAEHDRLVARLADAAEGRDAEVAVLDKDYVDGVTALDRQLAEATSAVQAAVTAVATASTRVADVDAEAERIWRTLRGRLGWRGRRLGRVPEPALPSTVDLSASSLLARAAARVATVSARVVPGPLPRGLLLACPLVGAVGATVLGLLAGGLATLAGAGLSTLAAVGWATFLLAPFAGLPMMHTWAVRGHRARLDGGAVGLTVLGGLVACCALIVLLR